MSTPIRAQVSLEQAEQWWPESTIYLEWAVPHLGSSPDTVLVIRGCLCERHLRPCWRAKLAAIIPSGPRGTKTSAIWVPEMKIWKRASAGVSSRPRRDARPYPTYERVPDQDALDADMMDPRLWSQALGVLDVVEALSAWEGVGRP